MQNLPAMGIFMGMGVEDRECAGVDLGVVRGVTDRWGPGRLGVRIAACVWWALVERVHWVGVGE